MEYIQRGACSRPKEVARRGAIGHGHAVFGEKPVESQPEKSGRQSCIDVYYLHNPGKRSLGEVPRPDFFESRAPSV